MSYQVIWDKNEGSRTGSLPSPTQGGTLETITILALYRDGTAIDLSAMTLTATMTDRDNNTTSVTGAFVGANGSFTWEFSAGDIGTAGRFDVIVTYTDGVDLWPSAPVKMDIIANPSATAVQNSALVGISTAKDAWLTASVAGNVATDIVQFNSAYVPTALEPVASMFWDSSLVEMAFVVDAFGNISMGKELWDRMTNLEGAQVINGDVVSGIGATGNRKAFVLTDATDSAKARACIGMVTVPTINDNQPGRITKSGEVRGLNTIAYTEGTEVFVDPLNNGKLTDTEPTAGNYIISVGVVLVSHASEGVITVDIRIVPKMQELSDVNSTPLTTTGQFMVWDNVAGYFDATDNITNYYPKTDFSASPGAAEAPLKTSATGGFVFGTSAVSIDSVNKRLGIGIAAPNNTLDINGTITSYLVKITAGTEQAGFYAASGFAGWGTIGASSDWRFFVNNTSSRGMIIKTTTGYIGIGNVAPAGQLHVTATTASTKGAVIQLAATPTANAIEVQTSAAAIQFAVGPAGELKTNQDAANTNTPSGATAHQLPIYNEAGTLLGYIPIYAAAW